MSCYPKDNPRSKHDICCPAPLLDVIQDPSKGPIAPIDSMDALASALLAPSSQQDQAPTSSSTSSSHRLATVYTYRDAPSKPKPLSGKLRIDAVISLPFFRRISTRVNNDGSDGDSMDLSLHKCTVAVKLPAVIQQYAHDKHKYRSDWENTQQFRKFMQYLQTRRQVGVMPVDSAGRIAFLIPLFLIHDQSQQDRDDQDEDTQYAAHLYYGTIKEFIPRAEENYHANSSPEETDERGCQLETWTPPYTPPPEEECGPSEEWDRVITAAGGNHFHDDDDEAPQELGTWTPQYTPPPEEECEPRGWDDEMMMNTDQDYSHDNYFEKGGSTEGNQSMENGLFVPPSGAANDNLFVPPSGTADDNLFVPPSGTADDNLFLPPGGGSDSGYGGFQDSAWDTNGDWDNAGAWNTANDDASTNDAAGIGAWSQVEKHDSIAMTDGVFHANEGAAAADAFYSGLTRSLDTRADSRLYHMRAFNGWVKATQIAELDPDTSRKSSSSSSKQRSRRSPLRVLDLACGKGGDLGKWAIHQRKLENYVGVDVARGSLIDAAIRARQMAKRGNPLKRCTFSLADLGEDVPGRKRSRNAKRMQKLLTWNLESETAEEREYDPKFVAREGGGIAETDKFDVVSIQFAIHYMMSTRKRARRFFHTVSSLLEIGGNLIATTIDARVVVEKLMGLGKDFHFDDMDMHSEIDLPENAMSHNNGNKKRKLVKGEGATVSVGQGVCRLKFDTDTLEKVFHPAKTTEDMFGLQYTFTLVEGSDHAAGVGEAVDLPEWLTPIPALKELGEEAGLELEYATNFHKFYEERKDPSRFTAAHNALYNMKVLNRNGSISEQEWEVSRMYVAVKFRKVRESEIDIGDEDVGVDEMKDDD